MQPLYATVRLVPTLTERAGAVKERRGGLADSDLYKMHDSTLDYAVRYRS
jgi:hypothetical protein